MPPVRQQRHIDAPLQNLLISSVQEADAFVGSIAAPFVNVNKQSDYYYSVPIGAYNTLYFNDRGSSERSDGAGWTLSNDTYKCKRRAVHHKEDWTDLAAEDEVLNSDEEAAIWLANQSMMELDRIFAATAMVAATWSVDVDWTTGSATPGTDCKEWAETGATPQADVLYIKQQIKNAMLKYPDVMIVGENVHNDLLTCSEVRSSQQYHSSTDLFRMDNEGFFAQYFGIQNYRVAHSAYNSSNPGQTASLATFVDEDDVWIGYVAPSPGRRVISALYTFAWKGDEGAGKDGMITRSWEEIETTSIYREVECFWDMKLISADCGAFIDGSTHS